MVDGEVGAAAAEINTLRPPVFGRLPSLMHH
jgi:hypothetical protein